jgi:hypothetical protein
MKNAIKLFGIIAIVAVVGFSFVACGGDDNNDGGGKDALDGTTWKAIQEYTYVVKFNSPNFTVTQSLTSNGQTLSETSRGTYTVSNSTVTFTYENGRSGTGTLSGNSLVVQGLTFTKQ